MTREAAEHFCPWKPKALLTTAAVAASRSAVSSTTMASLPPISRKARFSQSWPGWTCAARLPMPIPTSLEPVKLIKRQRI